MNFDLKKFREVAGYTQQELAIRIGKSFRTIQSWERGVSYPNAEALCDLCDLFGTDPDTILGWWEDHPRVDSPPLSADETELLDTYRLCTPEWKRNVQMTALSAKGESLKSAEGAAPVQGSMRGLEVEEMTA